MDVMDVMDEGVLEPVGRDGGAVVHPTGSSGC